MVAVAARIALRTNRVVMVDSREVALRAGGDSIGRGSSEAKQDGNASLDQLQKEIVACWAELCIADFIGNW